YGCDHCLKACPYMKQAPVGLPEFQPSDRLLAMQPHQWKLLTEEQYGQLFPQSAIARAGYEGLMRNIAHLDQQ
ncbi:MAG: tRNA epoxyqueuosine(34) reductase QueG, partial [Bacteroidaceae bacterium]|nr:tRNA epoxyqueuosine(34) reductase QueG [Bacteroidaceae bacterium]